MASTALTEAQFLAWGWRIPFLLSIALIGVGLFIRLRVLETPSFERVKQERREERLRGRPTPLLELLTEMPELASDLDVPARGSAHAPSRRGGTKAARG